MKRLLFAVCAALSLIPLMSMEASSRNRSHYPKSDDSFRVVTYNVGAFSKYQDNSTGMVAAMIKETGADIVGLNELDSVNTRHGVFQLSELASSLGGWDFHFGRAMSYAGGAYGNGIVSKEKILNRFVVTLEKGEGSEQRSMVVVETARCIFATAHLDHTSEAARLAQVRIIDDWMKAHYYGSTKPVILSGDMNAVPSSETLSLLKEDWDVLTGTDCTYDSSDPHICIDYIFHYKNSAPVKILGSSVMTQFRKGDVTKASDHLPVYVDLKFEKDSWAVAPKPLYRDPVHDGSADPEIIQNRETGDWYMFYTNRRADLKDPVGVEWAHGTPIGIAVSPDLAHWKYLQDAKIGYAPDEGFSYWAPSLIDDGKLYHMFLTYVPGIFTEWGGHQRFIIHLTSENLLDWKFVKKLDLMSDRVIDPDACRMEDGTWRLWYNQEPGGKLIAYAESPDLYDWTDRGLVEGIGNCEGPKAFQWKGSWWMICDEWKGLVVYRSTDSVNWVRQPDNILQIHGSGCDDDDMGRHCEVVLSGDRAFIFYFTHPGVADPTDNPRRSSIQVAELHCDDGVTLTCDRDRPVFF